MLIFKKILHHNFMVVHMNISVKGKVQGVFFRAYTREKANELGLKGFVKNMKDGSVYIEAEGEENVLNEFVSWCHKGSPGSGVEEVETAKSGLAHFASFKIEK
jgi:acylphosphatase